MKAGATIESAVFRIAILVEASRPASFAAAVEPPGVTSSNSSPRGSDCSETTTTPDCHTIPVRCRPSPRRTATTAFLAASARADIAFDNWLSASDEKDMSLLLSIKIGTNLRNAAASDYRPDGRDDP